MTKQKQMIEKGRTGNVELRDEELDGVAGGMMNTAEGGLSGTKYRIGSKHAPGKVTGDFDGFTAHKQLQCLLLDQRHPHRHSPVKACINNPTLLLVINRQWGCTG